MLFFLYPFYRSINPIIKKCLISKHPFRKKGFTKLEMEDIIANVKTISKGG